MKLKIVSDGTLAGTNVFTEDDVRIERVTRVEWAIDARDHARFATAKITLHGVVLDAVLDEGAFDLRVAEHIDAGALEAAKAKAQEWNDLDPPSHITADATRQIIEAYVAAL